MKILVYQGPGFFDDTFFIDSLELMKHQVECRVLDMRISGQAEDLSDYDWIITRGPWALEPECYFYTQLLIQKLKPSLDRALKNKKTKWLALGRGALMAHKGGFLGEHQFPNCVWEPLYRTQTWVPLAQNMEGLDDSGHSLQSYARVLDIFEPHFVTTHTEFTPWFWSGARAVSWIYQKQIYFSYLDLLGLNDQAQLENYGFSDLSQLSSYSDLVECILKS